jgi:glyoxylate/hydroxypyruvate reductase A
MTANALLVITHGWTQEPWRTRFRALLPGREVHVWGESFDPATIRYAATWKHPAGALSNLPNLAAILSLGAGVDHVFADPLLPKLPVARVIDPDLTERMSEWVVLHVLMHHRRQRLHDEWQRARAWVDDRDQPAARDVRVGMMGFGVLGQDAGRKLAAIGFDVAGWGATRKEVPGIRCHAGADELDAFLGRTDILVVLLPHTPATHGILNRDLFRKLARDGRLGGPFLLNAGRGGLQVEADILAALDDGTLKGATLDVFETEPLPEGSPLWTHPKVTITPHDSAISDHDSIGRTIARQILRFERGEPLENLVERERGY